MGKDSLNFDQFQELRAGIFGRKDVLMIGVDAAKRKHMACFCGPSRKVLVRGYTILNSRSGFEKFRDTITETKQAYGFKEVLVALESTGFYQRPLEEFLSAFGCQVVLVSNLASARNRQTIELSWDKSDTKDSEAIADLVMQGKFLYHAPRDDHRETVRRLLRHRRRLVRERSRCLIRIRNTILPVIFPELEDCFARLDQPLALRLLEQCPFPDEIQEQSLDDFLDGFRGLRGPFPRKKLAQIYDLAATSIGTPKGREGYRTMLRHFIEDIRKLEGRINDMERQIRELYRGESSFDHLQSIPGVGALIAAILLAEVGSIANYRSAKQLIKFAGLNVIGKQSGEYQSIRVISKMGNSLIRSAVYQAAIAAARSNSPLGRWYKLRSAESGKRPKKLLVALAAKILRIAFRIMKEGGVYQENYDRLLRIKQCHRELTAKGNKKTA